MHLLVMREYSRPVVKRNHEIVHIFVCMVMVVVVVIALTQIFVISNGYKMRDHIVLTEDMLDHHTAMRVSTRRAHPHPPRHHTSRAWRAQENAASRQVKQELIALEQTIVQLKLKNIPEIEKYRKILQNDIYAERISGLIKRVSGVDYSDDQTYMGVHPDAGTVVESIRKWNISIMQNNDDLHAFRNTSANRTVESRRFNSTTLTFHSRNSSRTNLDLCPIVPHNLYGAVFVSANHSDNMTKADVYEQNPDVARGGSWSPPHCISRHRVAVIIPYRDRENHLIILLSHLLPILQRQQLQFKIFVVEQEGTDTFNKARIMNAAFREAIQQYDFQCVVFHDVDLLPEDDRNMYSCPQQPRHMSVAIDEMGYKVPYEYLVGGVLSMRTDHYQLVNGYSNLYWGWGAEDDDMAFRIMHVGLKITRPPSKVARYKMIRHEKRKPTDWRKRRQLLRTGTRRFNFDGLNSVSYRLISIRELPLFTHILVNIGKPPTTAPKLFMSEFGNVFS